MSAQATPPGATPALGVGSHEAKKVADRLRTLAHGPMLADRREQLRKLAKALTEPEHAAGWADVPLHASLGAPIPEQAAGGRAAWLSGLRVVLVFVPLAVTWAGVSWAGSLYQRELERNPNLGAQSFFRLWLEGFGGAMPSFHVMALIVAVAVAGIIVLTVVIARAEARADQQRRRVEEELTGLLTEASLHLAGSRSPERFDDALTRAADNLAKLTADARSAAKATRAAAQKVTAATDAARQAAERTEQSAASVATVTSGLAGAVRQVETAMTRLISDAAARSDAAANAVTAAVSDVSKNLTDSVTALQQAVVDLVAHNEQHRDELVHQLDQDRDRLGMRLEQLLPDLVDRIASAQTAALDTHLAELRKAIDQLATEQRRIAAALDALWKAPALRTRLRQRTPVSQGAGSSASTGAATSGGGRAGGIFGWFRS